MNHFKDRHDIEYKIEWQSTDVTICGYFTGTIRNFNDWLFANLGYGNKIKSVTNIKTGVNYYIGKQIKFNESILDLNLQRIDGGIINGFFIDAFRPKIGATFKENIGRLELKQCDEIKEVGVCMSTQLKSSSLEDDLRDFKEKWQHSLIDGNSLVTLMKEKKTLEDKHKLTIYMDFSCELKSGTSC